MEMKWPIKVTEMPRSTSLSP